MCDIAHTSYTYRENTINFKGNNSLCIHIFHKNVLIITLASNLVSLTIIRACVILNGQCTSCASLLFAKTTSLSSLLVESDLHWTLLLSPSTRILQYMSCSLECLLHGCKYHLYCNVCSSIK